MKSIVISFLYLFLYFYQSDSETLNDYNCLEIGDMTNNINNQPFYSMKIYSCMVPYKELLLKRAIKNNILTETTNISINIFPLRRCPLMTVVLSSFVPSSVLPHRTVVHRPVVVPSPVIITSSVVVPSPVVVPSSVVAPSRLLSLRRFCTSPVLSLRRLSLRHCCHFCPSSLLSLRRLLPLRRCCPIVYCFPWICVPIAVKKIIISTETRIKLKKQMEKTY